MEQNPDKSSRFPLLIVGPEIPHLTSICADLESAKDLFRSNQNLYFLFNVPDTDLRKAMESLETEAGVGADQILVCIRGQVSARLSLDPLVGIFEITENDRPEEIRLRLQARLETQRHRKLPFEIAQARKKGLPSGLTAEEWCLRQEIAHLAHAFSCSLRVPASSHGASLRNCLETDSTAGQEIWAGSLSMEELLPRCARLAVRHSQTPSQFREELRKQSAQLPFRVRTELRETAERCLESIWKGISNAA